MKYLGRWLIALGLLSTLGCSSHSVGKASGVRTQVIEGILLDARCYFAAGAGGGDHTYCLFDSLASNLPAGILTDRGEFYYLAIESSKLAEYAARRLRVHGPRQEGHFLLYPQTIWVDDAGTWSRIAIRNDRNASRSWNSYAQTDFLSP